MHKSKLPHVAVCSPTQATLTHCEWRSRHGYGDLQLVQRWLWLVDLGNLPAGRHKWRPNCSEAFAPAAPRRRAPTSLALNRWECFSDQRRRSCPSPLGRSMARSAAGRPCRVLLGRRDQAPRRRRNCHVPGWAEPRFARIACCTRAAQQPRWPLCPVLIQPPRLCAPRPHGARLIGGAASHDSGLSRPSVAPPGRTQPRSQAPDAKRAGRQLGLGAGTEKNRRASQWCVTQPTSKPASRWRVTESGGREAARQSPLLHSVPLSGGKPRPGSVRAAHVRMTRPFSCC